MIRRFAAALLVLTASTASHANPQDANRENFTATISDYLSQRGHLCLAKYTWPIYVVDADKQAHTPDSLQMPVLEKLGLVTGKDMMVQGKDEHDNKLVSHARQYKLTKEGEKYYLKVPEIVATATMRVSHPADFCVASLSLDKVVGWEPVVRQPNGDTMTSVLYTYKITPAPWARTPEVQRVFPMVARVIAGEGTMQLREGVHLTPKGWVADEVFQR